MDTTGLPVYFHIHIGQSRKECQYKVGGVSLKLKQEWVTQLFKIVNHKWVINELYFSTNLLKN